MKKKTPRNKIVNKKKIMDEFSKKAKKELFVFTRELSPFIGKTMRINESMDKFDGSSFVFNHEFRSLIFHEWIGNIKKKSNNQRR